MAISVESLSLFPKIPRFRSRPHDVRGQVLCRQRSRQTLLTAFLGAPPLEIPSFLGWSEGSEALDGPLQSADAAEEIESEYPAL